MNTSVWSSEKALSKPPSLEKCANTRNSIDLKSGKLGHEII